MTKFQPLIVVCVVIASQSIHFAKCSPQTNLVDPPSDELIQSPAKQVVVQHPVVVNVADSEPPTTHPPPAPLKTRVVVVHNNMVPVPIECFQPPDSGTCSKDLARIYYDHETRTCKPYSYTGCGGNANRFQSIKNCYRICHPYRYKIRPKLANRKRAYEDHLKVIKIKAVPAQQLKGGQMASTGNNSPNGWARSRSMGGTYRRPPLPFPYFRHPPPIYGDYPPGYPIPPPHYGGHQFGDPQYGPHNGPHYGYYRPEARHLSQNMRSSSAENHVSESRQSFRDNNSAQNYQKKK